MRKIFFLTFFVTLFGVSSLYGGELTMRKCMLLPISDSVDGAMGYAVYEEVEKFLKDSSWCVYKSNSEIINILKNYKKNIHVHLRNKEVLKLIAEKSGAGSMIRIDLKGEMGSTDIQMDVIGENGEDIYFKESESLKSDQIDVLAQTIKNWLGSYAKKIPYDARVVGVLGNQFTLDAGQMYGIKEGDSVDLFRPTETRTHPLLKEVVEWQAKQIASATIFHARTSLSQGKILAYVDKERLRVGDWVVHRKDANKEMLSDKSRDDKLYPDVKGYEFGKIGSVALSMLLGDGSSAVTDSEVVLRKNGGTMLGAALDLELWATRNFFAQFELQKQFGSYKRREGNFIKESNSIDTGVYAFKMGYRYLPLGFFYGPRVDGTIGYAKYSYGLDKSLSDGMVGTSFQGLQLGVVGDLPLVQNVRVFLGLDFLITSKYKEDDYLYGKDDSSSNFRLKVGGSYQINPALMFISSFEHFSNKAKFVNPIHEYAFKNTNLKMGIAFTF